MNKKNLKNGLSIKIIIEIWLLLNCFISNISQLPELLRNKAVKIIIVFLWVFLILFILWRYGKKLRVRTEVIIAIGLVCIFDIIILISQLITTQNYLDSNLIYPIHLSIFILTGAYLIGQISNINIINNISKCYIISALIVGVCIYVEFFQGKDWTNAKEYLYTSKNSIAQIILIALIFLIIYKNLPNNVLKVFISAFLFLLLLMLRSRTTLLELAMAIGLISVFAITDKRKKIFVSVGLIILFIFLYSNEQTYNFIVDKLLFNNSNELSLTVMLSGRNLHYSIFMNEFESSFLVGNGGMYLESFPLAALISYGILGCIPLFTFAGIPLFICIKDRNKTHRKKLRIFIIILWLIMLTNGIFEELAPFGPGVKCYILWLITGLYLGFQKEIKIKKHIS